MLFFSLHFYLFIFAAAVVVIFFFFFLKDKKKNAVCTMCASLTLGLYVGFLFRSFCRSVCLYFSVAVVHSVRLLPVFIIFFVVVAFSRYNSLLFASFQWKQMRKEYLSNNPLAYTFFSSSSSSRLFLFVFRCCWFTCSV